MYLIKNMKYVHLNVNVLAILIHDLDAKYDYHVYFLEIWHIYSKFGGLNHKSLSNIV